jgi:hypothetical protein
VEGNLLEIGLSHHTSALGFFILLSSDAPPRFRFIRPGRLPSNRPVLLWAHPDWRRFERSDPNWCPGRRPRGSRCAVHKGIVRRTTPKHPLRLSPHHG